MSSRKLFRSCMDGNIEVCKKMMMMKGVDINYHFDCDCYNGYIDVVINHWNTIRYYRMTPLQIASENGHVQIVELLVKEGANVNLMEDSVWSSSALKRAAEKGHKAIVKVLIDAGADLNLTNYVGQTVSMNAAWTGQTEVLNILLEAGADISGSRNPLFIAARRGHKEITKMLVNAGADVTARDSSGHTPLTIALSSQQFQVAQTLMGHKAGEEIKEDFGRKVLDVVVLHLAGKRKE